MKTLSTNMPFADVTINRNKVKHYDDKIYMQDKTEFEILLHNGSSDTYCAMISLNGKLISQSGLVIRPGQKVYLERFLDTPKRFLFDTYTVDSASKDAIANNGKVRVEFFKETIKFRKFNPQPIWITPYNPISPFRDNNDWIYNDNTYYTNHTGTSAPNQINTFTSYSAPVAMTVSGEMKSKSLVSRGLETGSVEQGSYSSQKFNSIDKDFDTFYTRYDEYHILPVSQQVHTTNTLPRVYCTACGTKLKTSWKHCPTCGKNKQ